MVKAIKDSSAYINKEIKECRYWCERNAKSLKEDADQSISALLAENDFRAVKIIGIDLGSLALYYGERGTLSLIDGHDNGWQDIDHAMCYHHWNVKMAIGAIFKGLHQGVYAPPLHLSMPDIVSVLSYYYVHNLSEEWQELWKSWLKVLTTPDAIIQNYWDERLCAGGFYDLFMTRMFINSSWGKQAKLPEDLAKLPLGSYQAVLDAWMDAVALEEPLKGICDYHCQGIDANPKYDSMPPFQSSPFRLVPYEILAIYKLRTEQGLETPEIEHPLLALPTASREPRKVNKIDDPLFPRLQKLYEEQCLS